MSEPAATTNGRSDLSYPEEEVLAIVGSRNGGGMGVVEADRGGRSDDGSSDASSDEDEDDVDDDVNDDDDKVAATSFKSTVLQPRL